ncbi:MAG: polysaccharide biosynthesis tyrosine autokinase [Candidatus Omnitrophica bacterium]|nr:polysaccharide biosynthesis tyrosine autokinase [Candidatus Omnitrophota bacterium]
MLPSFQTKEVTIKDYLIVFKRRVWVILACFSIVTSIATIKTFQKIPLYEGAAKILIERQSPGYVQRGVYESTSFMDRDYIQSQINIFYSRPLAREVIKRLRAQGDVTFSDAEGAERGFIGGINVYLVPGTQILSVGYRSRDPIKAAKYANELTQGFIQFDIDRRSRDTKSASGQINIQLEEARKKLEAAEKALFDFLQVNKIVAAPDLQRKENNLNRLREEKLKIEVEIAQLAQRYKAKHPKMVTLMTRLDMINQTTEEENKAMLDLNDKVLQYTLLKRDVDTNKNKFDQLQNESSRAGVVKEIVTSNVRIVDLAEVPGAPFTPNRKRDVTTGAMFGLVLGFGLALLLEYIDSTVKTADDVEAYVRLPFLGYIPSAKNDTKNTKEVDLISHHSPRSRIAEAFRSIRTSVIFSTPEDRPLKTLLITSTAPQEGKSTISINLGVVFATANEKTVVIETDMRRPRIGNTFSLDKSRGLSSYLAGASDLDGVIHETVIPNLFIIPSGPKPPNPAELLISTKTRHLLEELKLRFDRIIIDSPPIMTVTDTMILANIVDGVVAVIKGGFLNIEHILKARQRLYEAKSRIIGVILNNVNVKKEDSYYYYHYYYTEDKEKPA